MSDKPALLVSYYYLAPFLERQRDFIYRDWALDSGAFSARGKGIDIDLDAYIRACKVLRQRDPSLSDIFALDVIGEWKPSLANCERMWKEGIEAIPTYHAGEPEDYLRGIARDYPKIALGGVARWKTNTKTDWTNQCFARVWPKRIHGFGYGGGSYLEKFPFHSVDATNWEIRPCQFGEWESFGTKLSIRGSDQNLEAEVRAYLRREAVARERWRREMAILGEPPNAAPTVRLAVVNSGREQRSGLMRKADVDVETILGARA
jgi:hypothetical protein